MLHICDGTVGKVAIVVENNSSLSLTLFGTIGTIVVVGTLVWVGTALVSLPFSPPAATREEKRESLGTPQTPAGDGRSLHPC